MNNDLREAIYNIFSAGYLAGYRNRGGQFEPETIGDAYIDAESDPKDWMLKDSVAVLIALTAPKKGE